MTAFDEASVRAIILQVQGWGDRHMITAHDRDILKRLRLHSVLTTIPGYGTKKVIFADRWGTPGTWGNIP